MKETTKNDYINAICKNYCENYDNCDFHNISINTLKENSVTMGCSAYKMKVIKNESK